MALTISSVLVLMVGALFLVQNDFYGRVLLRSQVQENARSVSELVASEVRSVAPGGMIIASSSRMVARAPMVTGVVCGSSGANSFVHVPGGLASIDAGDVAAVGELNLATGTWTYTDLTWGSVYPGSGSPAVACANAGADTTGATAEFVALKLGGSPAVGTVGMFFRKTEFKLAASALEPGSIALYRGNYGSTLSELATGMSSDAHFEYRTGGSTWATSVSGGALATIDAIRVVAESVGKGEASRRDAYEFGWTVDVPLSNSN